MSGFDILECLREGGLFPELVFNEDREPAGVVAWWTERDGSLTDMSPILRVLFTAYELTELQSALVIEKQLGRIQTAKLREYRFTC